MDCANEMTMGKWETMEEDERSSEAWPLGPRNHHLFVLMGSCVQRFLWHLQYKDNQQLTYINITFLMMCSWTIMNACWIISLWQVKTKKLRTVTSVPVPGMNMNESTATSCYCTMCLTRIYSYPPSLLGIYLRWDQEQWENMYKRPVGL